MKLVCIAVFALLFSLLMCAASRTQPRAQLMGLLHKIQNSPIKDVQAVEDSKERTQISQRLTALCIRHNVYPLHTTFTPQDFKTLLTFDFFPSLMEVHQKSGYIAFADGHTVVIVKKQRNGTYQVHYQKICDCSVSSLVWHPTENFLIVGYTNGQVYTLYVTKRCGDSSWAVVRSTHTQQLGRTGVSWFKNGTQLILVIAHDTEVVGKDFDNLHGDMATYALQWDVISGGANPVVCFTTDESQCVEHAYEQAQKMFSCGKQDITCQWSADRKFLAVHSAKKGFLVGVKSMTPEGTTFRQVTQTIGALADFVWHAGEHVYADDAYFTYVMGDGAIATYRIAAVHHDAYVVEYGMSGKIATTVPIERCIIDWDNMIAYAITHTICDGSQFVAANILMEGWQACTLPQLEFAEKFLELCDNAQVMRGIDTVRLRKACEEYPGSCQEILLKKLQSNGFQRKARKRWIVPVVACGSILLIAGALLIWKWRSIYKKEGALWKLSENIWQSLCYALLRMRGALQHRTVVR